jgi:aminoglycoside phosphotransferase (APT) family kinase protein
MMSERGAGPRQAADEPNPLAILAALGVREPSVVTPVTGGWDTVIWRVEHGGATYALRVFRADQAVQWRREVAVMQAVAEHGVPVPRVHATTLWQDRPALLLSWCPGRPVLHEVRARPWRAWSLGVAMGRVQARLHALRVPEALAPLLPAWIPRAGETELALQARLNALGRRRPAALLHLDYHPLNVMSADRTVTGVLDWANAAVGDPRADLARTVALLRLPPAPPGTPAVLVAGLRRVLEAGWRTGYQQVAGPFGDLALFYAWAGAMMERDLRPKLGKPGVWLQAGDLARIDRWTMSWKRRADIAP